MTCYLRDHWPPRKSLRSVAFSPCAGVRRPRSYTFKRRDWFSERRGREDLEECCGVGEREQEGRIASPTQHEKCFIFVRAAFSVFRPSTYRREEGSGLPHAVRSTPAPHHEVPLSQKPSPPPPRAHASRGTQPDSSQVGFSSWEEVGLPAEGVGGFAKRSVHVFVK